MARPKPGPPQIDPGLRPELKPDDLVQFVEAHPPYLEAGSYRLNTHQTVEVGDGTAPENLTAKVLKFFVAGERTTIPEDRIHALFPPPEARGKFGHMLPHVILNRSTLPWERPPLASEIKDIYQHSWLALLVFSKAEAAKIKAQRVARADPGGGAPHLKDSKAAFARDFQSEPGEHGSDKIDVIDVPWDVLEPLLPRYDDLPYLAHVRRVTKGDGEAGGLTIVPAESRDAAGPEPDANAKETAIVTAARLPPEGEDCEVHLVSLEHRYHPAPPGSNPDRRPAIQIKDPDLATWLVQARTERDEGAKRHGAHKAYLACELALDARRKPKLRRIDDRDQPHQHRAKTIPEAKLLSAAKADALCHEMLGHRRALLHQLGTQDTIRFLANYTGPTGAIGTVDATVRQAGWRKAGMTEDEIRFLAGFVPRAGKPSPDEIRLLFARSSREGSSAHSDHAPLRHLDAKDCGLTPQEIRNIIDLIARKAMDLHDDQTARLRRLSPDGTAIKTLSAEAGLSTRMAARKALYAQAKAIGEGAATGEAQFQVSKLSGGFWGALRLTMTIGDLSLGATLRLHKGQIEAEVSRMVAQLTGSFRVLRCEPQFDAGGASGSAPVRLISLKSWRFHNIAEDQSFTQELESLNAAPASTPAGERDTVDHLTAGSAAFHVPIKPLPDDSGEMPEAELTALKTGQQYLRSGAVALRHFLRDGGETMSWYRGPFTATPEVGAALSLPARGPDALLIYDPRVGMFDVSYAAAWELGRMMVLEDSDFAMRLYHWKQAHSRNLAHLRQWLDHGYLPLHGQDAAMELTPQIEAHFRDLALLKGVPINYLVGDEALLPVNSLRFFSVDPMWLEALRDGAFSVGRVLAEDLGKDAAHQAKMGDQTRLSGVLLRGRVVSEWQHLTVEGYTHVDGHDPALEVDPEMRGDRLNLERFERLGPNVLLCLFSDPLRAGREVQGVDIHLPAEVLHSGLELSAVGAGAALIKKLCNPVDGLALRRWRAYGARPVDPDHSTGYRLGFEAREMLAFAGVAARIVEALGRVGNGLYEVSGSEFLKLCQDQSGLSAAEMAQPLPGDPGETVSSLLLRTAGPLYGEVQTIAEVPFRDKDLGTLDVTGLASEVGNALAFVYPRGHRFSGADLALQMLDIPPLLRFLRPSAMAEGGGS